MDLRFFQLSWIGCDRLKSRFTGSARFLRPLHRRLQTYIPIESQVGTTVLLLTGQLPYLLTAWFVPISILSLLLSDSASAQEAVRIRSHQFDSSNITVGEAIQLRLLIEADENLHIYLDLIELKPLQHVELDPPHVKRIAPEKPVAGKAFYEVIYPLRAFAPGTHTLPPITIKFTDVNASNAILRTPAYSFEVGSVKPPDATEMKNIKPPFSGPRSLFPYILAIFLTTPIIAALLFWYLRRRFRSPNLPPAVFLQCAPHEIAHEQLSRIEELNLVAQGKMKAYHTETSQVIRQYIAARYSIPALELTTDDLLGRLSCEVVQGENLKLIRNFLTSCNLVKFAKYQPTKREAHERLDGARRIIDVTKQLQEPSETCD